MAEIIKKGNTSKTTTCKECKCVFSYLLCETHPREGHDYILCPECSSDNKVEEKELRHLTDEEEQKLMNKLAGIFVTYGIIIEEYLPKKLGLKRKFRKDIDGLYNEVLFEIIKTINKEAE